MISQSALDKAVDEFQRREGRAKFFTLAEGLIAKGFEMEACVFLLATWNTARFRMVASEFDLDGFRKALIPLDERFRALRKQSIESIGLSRYGDQVETIFGTLSKINGIEFTGATKVMHLKNPKLFIMWDSYIRGEARRRYYDQLEIVRSGEWSHARYRRSAEDYLRFLDDMKARFGHLSPPSTTKTLAKAIDEFNYVNITLPIREMEKRDGQSQAGKRRK